ncbi:carbon-monoxide dehydrogenase small subunit [Maritimibacter alkaliphilus HTCC2654]|jgi:carbon-monoxide dehydrogenase small subunit|uniref:Carbon-monoxide dehydrogenase small subunit n=1 Tax=Maritimibacter alkaliphilus HTCC2654 TaxID=314271 RepID=A3VDL5_9RHOB|nr:(2Fe-2S)-binding protein [Maritimibacter alkaliphilus]EAQ13604.1 carbon-monoxide dehydrogenase small subunit [Maritimibacter alkaliphilus HTCC2654]TYP83443.1 carbon-monoxide dehydrogenase small subunit [Maritimibacter alkaliphilus HTCC2654]
MSEITLRINGKQRRVTVEGRTLLVDLIRDQMNLTGTHVGCDTSQCGACVVKLDGDTVKSCTVLTATLPEGTEITTIEGVSTGDLHPMQEAFSKCHGLQCGFCTPGLVVTAIDIVERSPDGLSASQVRKALKGNLCRCTGYQNIVASVLEGARAMGVQVTEEKETV